MKNPISRKKKEEECDILFLEGLEVGVFFKSKFSRNANLIKGYTNACIIFPSMHDV